jgi:hypothetical protein
VAIGRSALRSVSTASNNIAIGGSAAQNYTGANNIVIGTDANYLGTSSNNNVILGYNAGETNRTGNNQIFIGYRGGYGEYRSNYGAINNDADSLHIICWRKLTAGDAYVGVNIDIDTVTSTFQVGGSQGHYQRTVDATYTAGIIDEFIFVSAGASDKTVNLPAASTCKGRGYTIKKIDSGVGKVIIDPDAGETVDGAATKDISSQYVSFSIISTGTQWFVY